MKIWEIWIFSFLSLFPSISPKARVCIKYSPLTVLFAISSLIVSLLFTAEKQENRANGKPATLYSP